LKGVRLRALLVELGQTIEWSHRGPLTPEIIEGELVARFAGATKP
jgi:hypothetical protein